MAYGELTILQHEIMTSLVRKFPLPTFIGAKLFPESEITSNVAQWDEIKQSRDVADYIAPDTEANVVDNLGVTHKTSEVACLSEKKQLKGSTMAWLRKPGTEHTQMKEVKIKEELEDLNRRLERRREWARWTALTGTLTIDQANIKFTVDYGIAGTHKPTVGTSWSDVSSDIIGDLKDWKKLIREDSGENPTTCYITDTIATHMMKNTGLKALMGENLKTQVLKSGYITNVCGLTFVIYDAGYLPAGGSYTTFIAQTALIMVTSTPFAEEQLAPSTDIKSGFKSGKFSKSWEDDDPAGVWVKIELNSLPVIKKVENIVYATVVK